MKYQHPVTIDGKLCKQVNKSTARKLFSEGKEVYLHPCNMILHNIWMNPYPIKLDESELESKINHLHFCVTNGFPLNYTPSITPELQFDDFVYSYETYNCIDELGKYANFFTVI